MTGFKKVKTRIEEIDNEKVKDVITRVRGDRRGIDLEIKYEGGLGIGYDGCGTHTHK